MTGASVRATNAARASAAHPLGRNPMSMPAPSGDHMSGDDDAISLSVRSALPPRPGPCSRRRSGAGTPRPPRRSTRAAPHPATTRNRATGPAPHAPTCAPRSACRSPSAEAWSRRRCTWGRRSAGGRRRRGRAASSPSRPRGRRRSVTAAMPTPRTSRAISGVKRRCWGWAGRGERAVKAAATASVRVRGRVPAVAMTVAPIRRGATCRVVRMVKSLSEWGRTVRWQRTCGWGRGESGRGAPLSSNARHATIVDDTQFSASWTQAPLCSRRPESCPTGSR